MEKLRIGKWGNSLALRLSAAMRNRHGLNQDMELEVIDVAGGIFLKPVTQVPRGMLTVGDTKTKEIVTLDPSRIKQVELVVTIENKAKGKEASLKISTSLVKVTVNLNQLLDQRDYIYDVLNLPNKNPLIMALGATQEAKGVEVLELWFKAQMMWKDNYNPLNDGDFMARLMAMKNQLKLL